MTDAERAKAAERGGSYGLWVAATFAMPLGFVLAYPSLVTGVVGAILVAVHVGFIPFWQQRQKQFLCSTAWAREQGFTPERIKLFAFGKHDDAA